MVDKKQKQSKKVAPTGTEQYKIPIMFGKNLSDERIRELGQDKKVSLIQVHKADEKRVQELVANPFSREMLREMGMPLLFSIEEFALKHPPPPDMDFEEFKATLGMAIILSNSPSELRTRYDVKEAQN